MTDEEIEIECIVVVEHKIERTTIINQIVECVCVHLDSFVCREFDKQFFRVKILRGIILAKRSEQHRLSVFN